MRKVLLGAAGLLAASVVTPALAEGDPAQGERVYAKCRACHSLEAGQNRVGPPLHDIVDQKAGAQDGYRYSSALQERAEEGLVWTEENLDAYLTRPRDFLPGGKMAFPGLRNPDERADVIAYLRSIAE